jgi:myotubularin-related protein 1/2
VFVQFLDAVWQLIRQHTAAFEFNEALLLVIAEQAYTGRFGTFLFDNYKQRDVTGVRTHTESLWSYVLGHEDWFANPDYSSMPGELKCAADDVRVWPGYVQRWTVGKW